MCTTCGCGNGETKIEGDAHQHEHRHADGTVHRHDHDHDHQHDPAHTHRDTAAHEHVHEHGQHDHGHDHSHGHAHEHEHVLPDGSVVRHSHDHGGVAAHGDHVHFGVGAAHAHAPGLSQSRMVQIEQDILAKNDRHARFNREFLAERGIFAVNLVSSPGSGKTTLLTESIARLLPSLPVTVIEGDQQTANDAERIRATGARALQINTGKGCHLDASMVERGLERLQPPDESVLFIENVGNLVCPAAFDLGEAHKVVVLSVTEGEDKPLKYPDMFRAATLMLLNKVDLLPYLDFDVARCIEYARRVNPAIEVMQVSATKGDGMDAWLAWVKLHAVTARHARVAPKSVAAE
ncbi:MAG: hydrogenase nickel incorporation protein HypB [Burkholderiaceae bacterium]|nr:hydrogenase nickel incorporation protein HypB [Burkholderiaceae bacterium]